MDAVAQSKPMAPPPVSYFLSPHEITRIKEAADKYFAGVFEQVDAAAAITAANARDGDGAGIGGPGVDFVWVHRASRATSPAVSAVLVICAIALGQTVLFS